MIRYLLWREQHGNKHEKLYQHWMIAWALMCVTMLVSLVIVVTQKGG